MKGSPLPYVNNGRPRMLTWPRGEPGGSDAFGTFTLTTPHGGYLTGAYDFSAPPSIPFEFMLRAAAGTKDLNNATGAILMGRPLAFRRQAQPDLGALVGSLER